MIGEWKLALAVTIEGFIAGRCYDPIAPADIAEIDVERMPLAQCSAVFPFMLSTGRRTTGTHYFANRPLLVAAIVGVGEQQWLLLCPFGVVNIETASQTDVIVCGRLVCGTGHHMNQNAIILFWRTHPSIDRWQYVQADCFTVVHSHRFRVNQQKYRFRFTFHARTHNVVHEHRVPQFRTIAYRLAVQCQFGRLQLLVFWYARCVEEQTISVIVQESLIDFTF